ncbi:hypothetical protein Pla100_16410 [Neorhodopirellula pilleata]|uniref:Uncharacterized protein n=1 Tax=Neorhodopirellula pilleata TaxID=2714738 RepID=A0A5C6APJ5_9BACT|nr:hypothetical protein Pla100_16410 [Neorhodopirellula pilleata]
MLDPPIQDAELWLKHNLVRQQEEASAKPHEVRPAIRSEFWTELIKTARRQLLDDAIRYTSVYRNVPEIDPFASRPIVMAGHQPTLFHPGVWFKNFALDQIGSDTGAHAINLVIDNDVASSRSIRVPNHDSLGRVRATTVNYDAGGMGMPFEQAKIRDLRQFDAFEREVKHAISPIVSDPLVTSLWPHARDAIRRCEIAGCALAQARHALEGELGWNTLEIPLGVAVRGLPFARFVMEIIDQFERFHQIYNAAAEHYRAWHGIRSTAHPVPNLAKPDVGDPNAGNLSQWWELPLWVYGNDSPQRRGVWVRRVGSRLQISDRSPEREMTVEVPAGDPDAAAEMLVDAASPEFKLRPRALVTTMFARLVLSDLFLHGIGGGKYDQLADRIIEQFFGVVPPAFQVVSATVRLPGQTIDDDRSMKVANLQRQIRDTHYQGERFLDGGSQETDRLVSLKTGLLNELDDHADPSDPHAKNWPRKQRWQQEIEAVNQQISRILEPRRAKLLAELERLHQQEAEESILASREWSFCLFSLEDLIPSFRGMLQRNG